MKLKQSDIFAPINLLLIVVNLVVFNLVSSDLFGRIDLTENRVYTLSDVTRDVLRNLEETLTIKAYFTRELPAPYNNIARYVEDQLAEMKAYGGGRMRYEFLDPADEEELKKEAEKFRLEPIQVNVMEKDKVEFRLAYLGMVLIYEDRQEVIPVVQSLENLEYEVLSKIKRVTSEEAQTIGFIEGHDELLLRQDLTRIDRELRKLYELKAVDLSARYSIPDDIDLLCLIGPKKDIPEKDRFAIDQFIMRGGKMLICLNKVDADLSNMQANRSALRIDPWTEHYGFRVNDDLVVDRMSPTLPFQTMTRYGRQITMVPYPLFPEVINFNRENLALKVLRQVRLYFPSSIDTSLAADMDSVTVTSLFWSSEKSTTQSSPYDINPLTRRGPLIYDMAHLPLGVLVQGRFTSYWKDRSIPIDEDGNPVSDEGIIPESPETRMVVIGDANFVHDQYIVPGLDNLTMMLNLIDWLAQDEALITIRSRDVSSRPIGEVSDTARSTVKWANILVPPLLVIGFGVFRRRIRRSARRMATEGSLAGDRGGEKR